MQVKRNTSSDRPSMALHLDAICDLTVIFFVGGCKDGGDFIYKIPSSEKRPKDAHPVLCGDFDTSVEQILRRDEQRVGGLLAFEGSRVLHRTTPVSQGGSRYVVVAFLSAKYPRGPTLIDKSPAHLRNK
jgi:hypothetical protein